MAITSESSYFRLFNSASRILADAIISSQEEPPRSPNSFHKSLSSGPIRGTRQARTACSVPRLRVLTILSLRRQRRSSTSSTKIKTKTIQKHSNAPFQTKCYSNGLTSSTSSCHLRDEHVASLEVGIDAYAPSSSEADTCRGRVHAPRARQWLSITTKHRTGCRS